MDEKRPGLCRFPGCPRASISYARGDEGKTVFFGYCRDHLGQRRAQRRTQAGRPKPTLERVLGRDLRENEAAKKVKVGNRYHIVHLVVCTDEACPCQELK